MPGTGQDRLAAIRPAVGRGQGKQPYRDGAQLGGEGQRVHAQAVTVDHHDDLGVQRRDLGPKTLDQLGDTVFPGARGDDHRQLRPVSVRGAVEVNRPGLLGAGLAVAIRCPQWIAGLEADVVSGRGRVDAH